MRNPDFLASILLLQIAVYALAFLNVPVARQIVGFAYFTLVPGFVVIKILRMKELDALETILFSVGLSVAFVMIAGFLLDIFGLSFGLSKPLSFMPLMITLNAIILLGTLLACSTKEEAEPFEKNGLRLPLVSMIIVFLPVLGIIGALIVTINGDSLLLLAMTIVVALVFVAGVASSKLLPSRAYPLAITAIALFLLYQSTFISRYLVAFGSDIPNEFFLASFTQSHAFWNSVSVFPGSEVYGRLYSMLSVTVLPAVYSTLLNLDMTWVFKILYPLIFSMVPLGLYQLWKGTLGEKRAFIAAFLLMAQSTFYTELLGLARQMIAEWFFVLLLIVIFKRNMKSLNKAFCFMIFSFALITAHYAIAEMFLFFILVASIYLIVSKHQSKNLTILFVVFFVVAMFSWYIYVSGSATFDSLVSFGNTVYSQLNNFFNPSSRGQVVLEGLGLGAASTIWNVISRWFVYLTEALIALGLVGIVTRRVNVQFEKEYSIFTLSAAAFLIALVVVPGLANTLNMTRFYHILLFFLAPVCVLGAEFLFHLISKKRALIGALILLLIVLVPYFLFQTGFVFELTGTQSWSLPLSKNRMDPMFLRWDIGYFQDNEVAGVIWISRNANAGGLTVYSDFASGPLLASYINSGHIQALSNATVLPGNSFAYLNQVNLAENLAMSSNLIWNTTSLSSIYNSADSVYSNGGCQIYNNANIP